MLTAMARPLRIEFPGAIYHVTSRGDRREPIFEDDTDRDAYLLEVCRYAELNPVRVSGPGRSRDEGIARAHREGSYSLSAIAREVGLSVPRVSRIVAAHVERSQPKGKTPKPA